MNGSFKMELERELTDKRMKHEVITIPEGGHGFAQNDESAAARACEQGVTFLKQI